MQEIQLWKSTYPTHTNLAIAFGIFKQEPADAHANHVWAQTCPWFVVDLIEQCKWIISVRNVVVLECNEPSCCPR